MGNAEKVVHVLDSIEAAGLRPTVISYTSAIGACYHATPRRTALAERIYRRSKTDHRLATDSVLEGLTRRTLGEKVYQRLSAELGVSKRACPSQPKQRRSLDRDQKPSHAADRSFKP